MKRFIPVLLIAVVPFATACVPDTPYLPEIPGIYGPADPIEQPVPSEDECLILDDGTGGYIYQTRWSMQPCTP